LASVRDDLHPRTDLVNREQMPVHEIERAGPDRR
jgi:hypothetical protein